MKISVVIPLFNKEKYISRTIKSVLNQNSPVEEIVIVDDGSTDGSVQKVLEFNSIKIRLVQQKNAGEGAARNRGISESNNELVAFLDADDEWKPNFISKIRMLVSNFPACGAYATAFEYINTKEIHTFTEPYGIPPSPWIGIIPNYFVNSQKSALFNSSSVAITKKAFESIGRFPENVPMGADRLFWLKLAIHFPIAYCATPQAIYHLEALNSAIKKSVSSYPIIASKIDSMITNGEIPFELLDDVLDYRDYIKIQRMHHLIWESRGREARGIGKIKDFAKKKQKRFIFYWIVSFLPINLLKIIRDVKFKHFIRND